MNELFPTRVQGSPLNRTFTGGGWEGQSSFQVVSSRTSRTTYPCNVALDPTRILHSLINEFGLQLVSHGFEGTWADSQSEAIGVAVASPREERTREAVLTRSQRLNAGVQRQEETHETLQPEEVIALLGNPNLDLNERRRLILSAEDLDFTAEQERELLPLLRDFIEKFRDSNEREDLIAVGSAIRNYVALMDVSRIGTLASLLEPGHRAVIPQEIELEIVKIVARKFAANPPAAPAPEPELATRLMELAEAYLNPRVLPRGRFSAIALLALQGLAGMRSPQLEPLLTAAGDLPFPWFHRQLKRLLNQLLDQWRRLMEPGDRRISELEDLIARVPRA